MPGLAVEPGDGLAALARRRLAAFGNVSVESSAFEDWDDRGRRFDVLVAASSWHWADPAAGWPKARGVLRPGGWMALLGNVTVRRPGEPEAYAETAGLHERFSPVARLGAPAAGGGTRGQRGMGPAVADPGGLFGPATVRWYSAVLWFGGAGDADHLRTRLGDRVPRRYLSMLRTGQRTD